ncbi:Alpha/beta hydrolase family protein [Maioricimonas rarisocia]|uniref:Alpha/beta hydrolase family protein n=1 Tax=Maioricimonas rarisocia TaxID=2528026 RepID=A0A517ZB89_9PLAN|nr:alpha/beta fold hydrolase [Maioricimonas rarisocia]QDU39728.1 Alpha/beta hydrolase family protein [Maioricimonas rarisocia]
MVLHLLVAIFGTFVVVDLLSHVFYAVVSRGHFSRQPPFRIERVPPAPDAEDVEIVTADGIRIVGTVLLPDGDRPHGVVIFCPEFGADRHSVLRYLAALRESGFALLTIDFRNSGESEHAPGYRPLHWFSNHEMTDVRAAVDYCRRRADLQGLPIGLFGVSRGGGAALAVAATDPGIAGVIGQSSFHTSGTTHFHTRRWLHYAMPTWAANCVPDWHIWATMKVVAWMCGMENGCRYPALERLLPRLHTRPVLLIAGRNDSYIPVEIPRKMCKLLRKTERALWVVPKAKHNREREAAPREFDRRVVQFFAGAFNVPVTRAHEPTFETGADVAPKKVLKEIPQSRERSF